MIYPINDIYTSIQGEGCLAGTPMVILRLQGCDVGCPWCDTKETWAVDPANHRAEIQSALGKNGYFRNADLFEISHFLSSHASEFALDWILLTGGEPAQYPLRPLIECLHQLEYKVALETSGTETGHVDAELDWVCVSPKINMPGGKLIQPAALACADEIKMVIGKRNDLNKLDSLLEAQPLKKDVTICLQPLSVSPKATQLCIQICQERSYRLSVQLHKYLDLP